VQRAISYAFVLNIMQKHVLYVQSFTLIKSTGARISSAGTGGIPSPTVQNIHSLTIKEYTYKNNVGQLFLILS
jgi:hypothetical protein